MQVHVVIDIQCRDASHFTNGSAAVNLTAPLSHTGFDPMVLVPDTGADGSGAHGYRLTTSHPGPYPSTGGLGGLGLVGAYGNPSEDGGADGEDVQMVENKWGQYLKSHKLYAKENQIVHNSMANWVPILARVGGAY
jgi:hypothetical protein